MKPACLLILPLFAAASLAGPLTLAERGQSSYAIGLSRDASPSEKRAAAELQRFLAEMTGARLPVITDQAAPAGQAVIAVGESAFTRGLKVTPPKGESYVLRTVGKQLVIAGGRQRGTLYGVYGFLDKLGCRWFTRDVSRIPKRERLVIDPLNETHSPGFEYREPYFAEAREKDWAARNRANGASQELDESTGGRVSYFPFVHSFAAMVPVEKYFKDHPEYFSLIEGKRRSERTQLCLTNPDVLRVAVDQVRAWIREHPEAKILSVSQNDWTGWCECDNCMRVEKEEGGVHSGPILRFVNAVAAEIEKTNPDKLIDTLAYWYTEDPPSKARPRPNVRIRLCPIGACEAHPYEKCERNAYFMKHLKDWSKITNQLYIWHYNTDFANYLLPFPDYDELAADIPMYKRYGVVGIFLEGATNSGGGAEDAEMRSYIMTRLLWDPQTNVSRDIDEYLDGVYGPAAKTMRAYHELRHKEVRRGQHLYIFQHSMVPTVSEEILSEGRKLLSQAEAQATTDPARRRVRHFRLTLDYVEAARARRFAVRNAEYAPANLDRVKELFASVVDRTRGFGITEFREGFPLDEQVKDVQSHLRPYRTVTLENDSIRADVVPELTGRVVTLINKRNGRDILRAPDPSERVYPDLGGIAVTVYPNYYLPAYPSNWKAVSSGPAEVVMEGATANGLLIRRVLRLNGRELVTINTVENTLDTPVPVTAQSRAEIAGDPAGTDIALEYQGKGGFQQNGILYHTGIPAEGSKPVVGAELPNGEWTGVSASAALRLVNRFDLAEIPRCTWSWSVRGENRLGMGVWTPERLLKKGEKLTLRTLYRVD
ncbi:MAG: DUF4838 domain-containing protein [Acidobacteria bacterium]|nr:DUF4838 domain-containing protein [Acidobacteriota bacterium]